ncbi:hypothetical protein [Pseudonocardia sp. T1-2H]|uniref:hypothetical protein n=1 Tax=Pseudonocardia sp. T1-2H TaxID=3128899 RepID=UPI0031018F15
MACRNSGSESSRPSSQQQWLLGVLADQDRARTADVRRPAQDELGRALAVFARQRADVDTISRAG